MSIELLELTEDNFSKWDKYVLNHSYGTVFHLVGWKKVIEESYGFKPLYFYIKDNGKIIGLLPSFLIKTFFGKIILSQPFGEYGGPLANDNSLIRLMTELFLKKFSGIKMIEFKLNPFYEYKYSTNIYDKANLYYLDTRHKDFDFFWNYYYTKKSRLRNQVRKAKKNGLVIERSNDILKFYKLYLMTCRRQISPPHSFSFFKNIFKYLKDYITLFYAKKGNKTVSGMISFNFNKSCLMWKLSTDSRYFNYYPTVFLYDNQLRFCCDNKLMRLEFGRTQPNSSNEIFKLKWKPCKKVLQSYIFPKPNEKINNPYKFYFLRPLIKLFSPIIINKKIGPIIKERLPV